jgi:type II secretory pathway pseudopilin PulG
MKMQTKKRHFSLLEIMIVIFLIGLIGGTIGYNMKGSLDKGRVFKTEESIRQIEDILQLQVAEGTEINEVAANPEEYLNRSGLVKDSSKLLHDGWGGEIDVSVVNDELRVKSKNLEIYNKKKKKK